MKLSLVDWPPSWIYENVPSALSVSAPLTGVVPTETLPVGVPSSASVSLLRTDEAPPTRVVAVPPSATAMASATATGAWLPELVTVIVTVVLSSPLTPSLTVTLSENGPLAGVTALASATVIAPLPALMAKAPPVLPPAIA